MTDTSLQPAQIPTCRLPGGEEIPCIGMGTFGSDKYDAGTCLLYTSCDLRDINITVAHGDCRKVLLFDSLSGCGKLGNGTKRCRLGRLAACIGINLRIEYEDVDILAGGQRMVNAAEADIIGPAVAAEDPHGLLGKIILIGQRLLCQRADLAVTTRGLLELRDQRIRRDCLLYTSRCV